MGGSSSVSVAVRVEDYSAELTDEQQLALAKKAKTFTLFSEDLEYQSQTLVAKANGEPTIVGRRTSSDVMVNNPYTSGKQLELTLVNKRWRAKDAGSSAKTAIFWGNGKEITLNKSGESHELPVNCCMRLGSAFVTLVPDSMPVDFILECTKGPANSKWFRSPASPTNTADPRSFSSLARLLVRLPTRARVPAPVEGKFWRLPKGMYVLDCGTSPVSVVQLENTDLSPIEFRIFKYNGWYCVSCIAERVAQAASKKGKNEEAAENKAASKKDKNEEAAENKGKKEDPVSVSCCSCL